MNAGGDAAEQVVRFYLEGFEVMAKLSGKGAERVIALLLNVIKDHKQTKGKARLNTMLKSGKPLSIFTITCAVFPFDPVHPENIYPILVGLLRVKSEVSTVKPVGLANDNLPLFKS